MARALRAGPHRRRLGALPALVLLAGLATGCAPERPPAPPPPAELAFDPVARFADAEIARETARIDFGTPAAHRHMERGWYPDERGSGEPPATFNWSSGRVSTLRFFLVAPPDPSTGLTAELTVAPLEPPGDGTQAITVSANGTRVTEVELGPGIRTYPVTLPAGELVAGVNRLAFGYRRVGSPAETGASPDRRQLAVAWYTVRFRPAPSTHGEPRAVAAGTAPGDTGMLELPAGSEVAYYVEVEGRADLVIERLESLGEPGGGPGDRPGDRLAVAVRAEGGAERPPVVIEPGPGGPYRVRLPGLAKRLLRLALRAVPGEAGDGDGGLRLFAPAVRCEPPERRAAEATGGEVPAGPAEGGGEAGSTPSTAIDFAAVPPPDPDAAPNVVLYLIDTLRRDRVGAYGGLRGLTPELDAFAAGATVFVDAVAQAPWTRPSVASLFTGLGPLRHGVRGVDDRLPAAATTLAERLREAGWRTAAFATNWHVSPATGFDQGFEDFVFTPDDAGSEALARRAAGWLDTWQAGGGDQPVPFFLFVHALDPHAPYQPPEDLRLSLAPEVPSEAGSRESIVRAFHARGEERRRRVAELAALYDAEVAANDRGFGELRSALAERGLWEGSLVVVVSDHGEELGEHGGLGHARSLYGELLDVPLIVKLPGQRRGRRDPRLAQHVDLVPTVLGRLGLEIPGGLDGIDLFAPSGTAAGEERAAVADLDYAGRRGVALIAGGWKLILPLSRKLGLDRMLFRRARDRNDSLDLAALRPVRAGYLETRLRATLRATHRALAAEPVELDEEARQALGALGYL